MSRIRKANENAVEKTVSFLESLKWRLDNGVKFNSNELHEAAGISKSTYSAVKKLGFVEKGKWMVEDPKRGHALEVLEILRQQASKRIDVDFGGDFKSSMDSLISSMNTLSLQNEKSLKSPLLSRALNQAEQSQGNHLFSQVESDESKKFELLKSIANGLYSSFDGDATLSAIYDINEIAILATEDLFNKFFKVK